MPYSWRNNLSTTVDSFLQVLSKWLEHFVENEFIIEPCLDVVAGHGQFHAILRITRRDTDKATRWKKLHPYFSEG